ncbi:MAG: hypothetical protein ACO2OU_03725 [Thermus aquaticus]|uniref:hypothetical protein n=1 Tax=Thermus aquaticus TaxID=271 RepID=UPI003C047459
MPSVGRLNRHHEDLQRRVVAFARTAGWSSVVMTYHNAQNGDVLRFASDSTGLYVRTIPDLVLSNGKEALMVEVKSHTSTRYSDATIELVPLITAKTLWQLMGVRTLYVYEDPNAGISAAWWAHEVFDRLPVKAIYVGTQRPEWDRLDSQIFLWQFSGVIPRDVPVVRIQPQGSGDPFVVIPEATLRTLLPWEETLGRVLGVENPHEEVAPW